VSHNLTNNVLLSQKTLFQYQYGNNMTPSSHTEKGRQKGDLFSWSWRSPNGELKQGQRLPPVPQKKAPKKAPFFVELEGVEPSSKQGNNKLSTGLAVFGL